MKNLKAQPIIKRLRKRLSKLCRDETEGTSKNTLVVTKDGTAMPKKAPFRAYHVLPTENGWGIFSSIDDHAVFETSTKDIAISFARKYAMDSSSALIIYGTNGQCETQITNISSR